MTSETLASLSDTLFAVAVVAYTAALLATAVAWAAGRDIAPVPVPVPVARGEARVAVGVGPREADGSGSVATSGPASGGAPTAPATGGPTRHPAGAAAAAARVRWADRSGLVLTVAAAAVHLVSLASRGLAAGHVPWSTMYEFTSSAVLVAVVTYLVLRSRGEAEGLAPFVLLPVVLSMCVGASLYVPVGELQPALQSYWLVIHVSMAVIATGVFTVGGVAATLLLVRTRWDSRAAVAVGAGGAAPRGIGWRLPSARALDALSYRANAFGFPVWTLAVILGAVWAREAWTRAWGWDPKETWAFISWVLYAAYLHARTTPGWRGTRATVLGLVAFASILFNYFAVNLLFSGLHSYSGL